MSEAFECDGCGDLFAGEPTLTATLGQNLASDWLNLRVGQILDLCAACSIEALEPLYRETPDPSDTTYEQEDNNDADREWDVDAVQCENCGDRYPADYSRCNNCGTPNQKV